MGVCSNLGDTAKLFAKVFILKLLLHNGGISTIPQPQTFLGADGRIPFLKFVLLVLNNKIGYLLCFLDKEISSCEILFSQFS